MNAPVNGERSAILTIAFGTTVAMWGLAYFLRLPAASSSGGGLPGALIFGALVAAMFSGGFVSGGYAADGVKTGFAAGAASALLNLLILGSLLAGPRGIDASALWWIPASVAVGAALGGVGAYCGRAILPRIAGSVPVNWLSSFAFVAACATFLLLIVGGLVTSNKAGLAVVDWPNTFGSNMFLYPLSRMTGGIYYEHAHRLIGSLVGLTTLALTIQIFRIDGRRWLKYFATVALLVVIVQGTLGGLRVTGRFTLSQSATETAPSIVLAVIHGVLAQIFLGMIVAIWAFTSRTWRNPAQRAAHGPAGLQLGAATIALLFVQLVLGASQRHLARGLLIHMSFAIVVALSAIICGARLWGMNKRGSIPRRVGATLTIAVAIQILLGFFAMVAIGLGAGDPSPSMLRVLITTLHQATGAFLMSCAVLATVWSAAPVKE